MILAILVNTAGITIYPHFCAEEGEVSLNFFKKDNCCPTERHQQKKEKKHSCCQKKTASVDLLKNEKDNCCKQESFTAQWHLNEFSFEKQFEIIIPVISLNTSFRFISLPEENLISIQKTESPPLHYSGRDILSRKQSFLI